MISKISLWFEKLLPQFDLRHLISITRVWSLTSTFLFQVNVSDVVWEIFTLVCLIYKLIKLLIRNLHIATRLYSKSFEGSFGLGWNSVRVLPQGYYSFILLLSSITLGLMEIIGVSIISVSLSRYWFVICKFK
jgi:hypothetical protein